MVRSVVVVIDKVVRVVKSFKKRRLPATRPSDGAKLPRRI